MDTPADRDLLIEQLALPLEQVRDLLRDAAAIGDVRRDSDDRYAVEPAIVAALVQQNRTKLLGAAT